MFVTLLVVSATSASAASVQAPSPSTSAPAGVVAPAAAPQSPVPLLPEALLPEALFPAPRSPALHPPALHPPAPEVARKHKVLLLGDSLIATGFGEYLQAQLDAHPRIQSARRAKSSTGLARPDFFDWMNVGREEVERHQPDVVVVILGGNDGQSLQDTQGGKPIHWGHAEWEAAYRQRMKDFLTVLAKPGRKIVWLELPTTGLKRFEQKLRIIRAVQREVISSREDAVHLDTHPFFTDAKGRALRQARVEGFRRPMRLRMQDGVHFTVAGGRYFANKVYPEVLGVLGLLQQG
nr:SGNH family hydrolase [Corallococcus macrosporus]